MLVNRVRPARHLLTIREMVESFAPDLLSVTAVQSRRPDGWWKLSYGELRDWVRSLGAALLAAGVRQGDRVGVISENRSEWVITYLAVTCVGAVIVPFDVLLKAEELAAVMKAAGPVLVFTSTEYLEKVRKAQAIAGASARLAMFDAHPLVDGEAAARGTDAAASATAEAAKAVPFAGWKALPFGALVETGRLLRGRGRDPWAGATVKPKDLAALIFTSGTTGTPKGVMLSHGALVANGDGVQQSTVLGPTDNWLIVLPFHHTYPTMMGVFVPLLTNGTITCVASMKLNVLVQAMKETQPTAIPAIPLLIEKLYKGIHANVKAKGVVTRALFAVLFAVEPVPLHDVRDPGRQGAVQVGGRAARPGEAALLRVRGRPDREGDHRRHGGPRPADLPGLRPLRALAGGRLVLPARQPARFRGPAAREREGAHRRARRERQRRDPRPRPVGHGRLPRHARKDRRSPRRRGLAAHRRHRHARRGRVPLPSPGRLKNIIVTSGGKNIYPEEIENLIAASPLVAEVVVVGKRGAQGGEEPHAIVHPNRDAAAAMEKERGSAFSDEELRKLVGAEIRRCTAAIAAYKTPRSFEVSREELPKTSSSKVKRFLFADRK